MGAIKKMKGGKTAGMDDIAEEMLKTGLINITDWLLRLFSRCMESGVVPEDWKVLYSTKGKLTGENEQIIEE